MNCPRCGFNNSETANFCSRCGLQLIKATGQRRPVAVVFADISGFTPLAEKLDPEDVKELIDQCLQRLARVIQNYEGFIDKFIGDCIMALFGAPIAHEDDPLRAVLASLDLLKEIKRFNQEKKQKLSLSIGINYGLVATGDLGRPGGYTVMGDSVNLAQRLQHAAPRGEIYVSEEVYKHTFREIVYKKQKKFSVKGRREKVLVYKPIKAKLRYSQRKIQEIPLIGRTEEMNILNKTFQDVQSGKGRVVAIVGEAGIGKTKLVYEFKRQLEKTINIIEGKGIEYHINSPYFVLREMLKKIFSINDTDTPGAVSRKIIKFLEMAKDSLLKIKIPYYKYFLSADLTGTEKNHFDSLQVETRSRLLLEAIHMLFMKLARPGPLIMIFDDCHWIDKETIEFMHSFARAIGYKPIMLIALYRPTFDIGLTAQQPYSTKIELKPLAVDETITLLKTIFHCDKVSDNLLRLLLEKSGSVPFYISELAMNFINNNMVDVKEGIAQLKEKVSFAIPRSLDELVMTKIDSLSPELRYIVNIASVIGEEFSFKLLNALIPGKEHLRQNLSYIAQQNIIKFTEGAGSPDDEKYSFTHSIIRDAVYNSLLKKERKEYHQKVGYMMEKVFNLSIEEYYDALAHHFYLGEEMIKALEYMEKAGDKKKELYLNNAAIELYRNCLSIVPASMPQISARLYEKLGDIYELIGDYGNALSAYRSIIKYAEGDPIIQAHSLRRQALIFNKQGNYDMALDYLMQAGKRLKMLQDQTSIQVLRELSELSSWESWIYRIKGKMEVAESKGIEAISIIKGIKNWQADISLKRTLIGAYNNLAIIHHIKGEFTKSIDLCKEALLITEELGDQRRKGSIYNTLGLIYRMRGEYDQAVDSFTMYLKISEELEDKYNIGIAHCNLGNVYQNKGEYTTAIGFYERFLKICEELGDKSGIATAINNIGIVYFNKGEYEKAIESFERYVKISREMGEKRGEGIAYGNLGEIYYNKFEYKRAIKLFKKYLKIGKQLNAKREIAMASYNLGQVYIEIGKLRIAQRYLNDAKVLFESLGNKIFIGMVLNSIAYLRFKQGKIEESIALLRTAQEIAERMNAVELKVYCLLYSGIIFSKTDQKAAEMKFQEAIKICLKSKYKKTLADVYYEYAKFLKLTLQKREMKRYYNEAMKIYKSMGIKRKDSMRGK